MDTQRVYTLQVGPAWEDAPWQEDGVKGSHKFLRRAFESVHELSALLEGVEIEQLDPGALTKAARELRWKAHDTIQRVTDDLDGRFSFHTAIARLIELEHALPSPGDFSSKPPRSGAEPQPANRWKSPSDRATVLEAIEILVVLLAPFAPHLSEELWHGPLAHPGSVFDRAWPEASEHALVREEVEYAIQVNGKIKAKAMFPADASERQIGELAVALPAVQALVAGKAVKMVKVVLGRLVNIVVAG
ncbi:class I tRNA ligase family protein [bacterium]|nr:class I tRNA ligase family protein [bacterium]